MAPTDTITHDDASLPVWHEASGNGSRDANRCIGYLTKYLTKHVADCHPARTSSQQEHAERLADTLRYEPCSPTFANWLRYGIQPKNPRPDPRQSDGLQPRRATSVTGG